MTEALLVSSAPVFEVDGIVQGELTRDVVRLEIKDSTAGLKTFSVRLNAQGPVASSPQENLLYLDGSLVDFGKKLNVALGPPTHARSLFAGYISGIEAGYREGHYREVVLFAEDPLMKLRMTRRMRTYERVTDAQIAEAIGSEHGFKVAADADGPTYDVVQQWNMSDLAFLRERASLLRAEIWFHGDTLHFATRERRNATELTLVKGNHILALQARADLAHQRTKVRLGGYDAYKREAIDEEAGPEAIQAEVARGRTGPAILQRAFGERISYRVRQAPQNAEDARHWARAEMLRRARSFVSVVATTRGSPDLVVGSRVTLERVGRTFDGPGYYVTRVCHTYDLKDGHRTGFEAERATVNDGGPA